MLATSSRLCGLCVNLYQFLTRLNRDLLQTYQTQSDDAQASFLRLGGICRRSGRNSHHHPEPGRNAPALGQYRTV